MSIYDAQREIERLAAKLDELRKAVDSVRTLADKHADDIGQMQGFLDYSELQAENMAYMLENSRGENGIYISRDQRGALVIRAPDDTVDFSFKIGKPSGLTAPMTPGSVELGPATVLTWLGKRVVNGTEAASGCFTNYLTHAVAIADPTDSQITVAPGASEWYVWANIDIREEAECWDIHEGATIAPLTVGDEQGPNALKNTAQKIIAYLVIEGGQITQRVNRQCGNIDISRL